MFNHNNNHDTKKGRLPWAAYLHALVVLMTGCVDAPMIIDEQEIVTKDQAIVNGVADHGHPAVGLLLAGNGLCSSTLIGPRTVLTAAHCVVDKAIKYPPFKLKGPIYLYAKGYIVGATIHGTSYRVISVKVHPHYTQWGAVRGDVAVLRLDRDVAGIVPKQLASKAPYMGEPITIVGYGNVKGNKSGSGVKRRALNTVGLIEQTNFKYYGATGSQGNGCSGDSGGAVLTTRGGREVLLGVHSHGNCGYTGLAQRVDPYLTWIIKAAAGDLSASPLKATILTPVNKSQTGPRFQVRISVTGGAGVARVDLMVDGYHLSSLSGAPFNFQLDHVATGPHTIKVVARDGSGRTSTASISITVVDKASLGTTRSAQGATCNSPKDCTSGLCARDSVTGAKYCVRKCDLTKGDCPGGTVCQPSGDLAVCAPLHDGNGMSGEGGTMTGTCSMSGTQWASPPPSWLLLFLIFFRTRRATSLV